MAIAEYADLDGLALGELVRNAAGLPVGAHVAARYGDETTLLQLAAQLEKRNRGRTAAPH